MPMTSWPRPDPSIRQKVSATIIAKNEADRIGRAIESMRGLVDEVVVIDSGSTDGTQALAESLGARVIHNDWVGYGPQKRFAEEQARNDWIFNLDADEWLSDPLRDELRTLLSQPDLPSRTYKMRVTIVYPQRETPAPFADSTICLRLYDRRAARFSPSLVHDNVPEDSGTLMLAGRIYHKSFRRLADVIRKELAYFELQAVEKRKSRTSMILRLPTEFPWQFFRYYILARHVFGGLYGFAAASTIAFMRFMRLVIMLGW
jgi:glycosyltransferase involved in cell wall biosynthesis